MIAERFPELRDILFSFERQGTPLPADRRPLWRIALIVQLLSRCSRGGKSSLLRLRILDWAARHQGGTDAITSFLAGELRESYAPVRYDPALLRALAYGTACGVLSQANGRVALTERGAAFAGELKAAANELTLAEGFVKSVERRFLESHVKDFLEARD